MKDASSRSWKQTWCFGDKSFSQYGENRAEERIKTELTEHKWSKSLSFNDIHTCKTNCKTSLSSLIIMIIRVNSSGCFGEVRVCVFQISVSSAVKVQRRWCFSHAKLQTRSKPSGEAFPDVSTFVWAVIYGDKSLQHWKNTHKCPGKCLCSCDEQHWRDMTPTCLKKGAFWCFENVWRELRTSLKSV